MPIRLNLPPIAKEDSPTLKAGAKHGSFTSHPSKPPTRSTPLDASPRISALSRCSPRLDAVYGAVPYNDGRPNECPSPSMSPRVSYNGRVPQSPRAEHYSSSMPHRSYNFQPEPASPINSKYRSGEHRLSLRPSPRMSHHMSPMMRSTTKAPPPSYPSSAL